VITGIVVNLLLRFPFSFKMRLRMSSTNELVLLYDEKVLSVYEYYTRGSILLLCLLTFKYDIYLRILCAVKVVGFSD